MITKRVKQFCSMILIVSLLMCNLPRFAITAHAEDNIPDQEAQNLAVQFSGAYATDEFGNGKYQVYARPEEAISFGPTVLTNGNLRYQWQRLNLTTMDYEDIVPEDNSGANSPELTVRVTADEMEVEGLYRCVVTAELDGTSVSVCADFRITSTVLCQTMEEAAILLREHMKSRKKYYSFAVPAENASQNETGILDLAYAHTGVPTEGDYLKNHVQNAGYSQSYCEINAVQYVKYDFDISYRTTAEQEALMDDMVAAALEEIDQSSGYSAVIDIYLYIRDHVTYDHYHYGSYVNYFNYQLKQTAYGAFIDGTAVCEGIAALFYRLALECGIDARLVTGYCMGPHAWNIVKVDDSGDYYGIDATYDMFLLGDEMYWSGMYTADHAFNTAEFLAQYPMAENHYQCTVDYTYDPDTRTLTIPENLPGFYKDGNHDTAPWPDEIRYNAETVIISEGVTSLGYRSFADFYALKRVVMPDSVVKMGDYAFSLCINLNEIQLSQALQNIGAYAFYGCDSEFHLTIPDCVTSIDECAFNSSGLANIHFSKDTRLKIIENDAFNHTNLTDIAIPDTVTYIGDRAFLECGLLSSVSFSEHSGLLHLGDYAFYDCNLNAIRIPEGLTRIGEGTFGKNEFTNVSIPDGVTYIGDGAFRTCHALSGIILPDSLTHIGDSVFAESKIRSLQLPEKLRSMGDDFFDGLYLTDITVHENNPYFYAENKVLYGEDGSVVRYCCYDREVSSFTVPDTVTVIGNYAFINSGLKEVILPESVVTIGDYAFYECGDLLSMELPESVTSIGDSAFLRCVNLTEITIPKNVVEIGTGTFSFCTGLASVNLPEGLRGIGEEAFSYCSALETIALPDHLRRIGLKAFYQCPLLSGMEIPGSVSSIGAETFGCCTSLKNLKLPERITVVDGALFSGCSALEKVYIPAGVERIAGNAFKDCTALTTVYFGGTEERWNAIMMDPSGNDPLLTAERICAFTGDETITVSFDGNGYGEAIPDISIHPGSAYKELPTPQRDGYTFYGWFTEPVGGVQVTSESVCNQTENHILYAHWEDTVLASGSADNGFIWTLHKTGELVICGKGEMPGFASSGAPWYEYREQITSVTLDERIQTIGANAFESCTKLTEVYLPEGIWWVGDRAFYACTALTEMELPWGVEVIGAGAFNSCKSLENVLLPNSLRKIDDYAFRGCSALTGITLPDSLTHMNAYSFSYCSGLTNIVIPDSVTFLGDQVFYSCSALESVTLGSGLETTGNGVFQSCSRLTDVNLKQGLQSIGIDAFQDCTALVQITIPDSVRSIQAYAFAGCTSLKTVSMGCVTDIGVSAFSGCSALSHVQLPNSLVQIGNRAFADCTSMAAVALPDALKRIGHGAFMGCSGLAEIHVPNSVTDLGLWAFGNCVNLCHATLPAGVTRLGNGLFYSCEKLKTITLYGQLTEIGDHAFYECGSLETIYWSHTRKMWEDVVIRENNEPILRATVDCNDTSAILVTLDANGGTLSQSGITVTYGSTYGELPAPVRNGYLFRGWYTEPDGGVMVSAETIVRNAQQHTLYARWWKQVMSGTCGDDLIWTLYENGQMEISGTGEMAAYDQMPWAEYNNQITGLVVSEGVKSISANAFDSCLGLLRIDIASSVTKIDSHAFYGCSALHEVILRDGLIAVGDYAFANCVGLTFVSMPSGATELGSHVFAGCTYLTSAAVSAIGTAMFSDCIRLSTLEMSGDIKTIGANAFYRCSAMESFAVPDSVTSIGDCAFYECANLTEVTLPEGLLGIGENAFWRCTKLDTIVFPDTLTSIGKQAFWDCSALERIIIPDGVTQIGAGAFMYCRAVKEVILSESCAVIPENMLFGCETAEKIMIPEGVVEIGKSALSYCVSLQEIIMPDSVKKIGNMAFNGDTALSKIVFLGDAPEFVFNMYAYPPKHEIFVDVVADAYYLQTYDTWTEDVLQGYGGTLTWHPYLVYDIIEESTDHIVEADEALSIHIDAEHTAFTAVYVDGKLVDSASYTITGDKTIITFAAEYLNTLAPGNHEVQIHFGVGMAVTTITVPGSSEEGMLGDLNLDGEVDSDDLTLLARHVGGIELVAGQALANADVNGDGVVNSDDLTRHARYVGGIITSWDQV